MTCNLPMYEKDDEQDDEQVDSLIRSRNKSGGILDLIMSIAVPGYGFLKNIGRGGLEGIRGLNQRIQQSDFGRSKTLADYLMLEVMVAETQEIEQLNKTMREARAIQNKLIEEGALTKYDRG